MAEIDVKPDVLEAFAKTSDRRGDAYDRVREKAGDVRVGRESFGKIPWISSKVYDAYDEHVRDCEDGIASAAEAMEAISRGVRTVIANYAAANQAVKDDLKVVEGALGDVNIRGVQ